MPSGRTPTERRVLSSTPSRLAVSSVSGKSNTSLFSVSTRLYPFEVSCSRTSRKFIDGEPMNSATKRFVGRSYTSLGLPTCWSCPLSRIATRSPIVIASS
jgi:hypothetical protein